LLSTHREQSIRGDLKKGADTYVDMAPCCQQARNQDSRIRAWISILTDLDYSYFTPEGERDAREALATIDHADIRGLVTAFHLSVAGLPRSKVGDYPKDAHITCSRIPHIMSRASRSYSSVLKLARY
jgi:hypothetical protein